MIDEEVRRLVERCDNEVRQLLSREPRQARRAGEALLERETLDEADAYAAAGIQRGRRPCPPAHERRAMTRRVRRPG